MMVHGLETLRRINEKQDRLHAVAIQRVVDKLNEVKIDPSVLDAINDVQYLFEVRDSRPSLPERLAAAMNRVFETGNDEAEKGSLASTTPTATQCHSATYVR